MIDFKKTDKYLYQPGVAPALVDVPTIWFLCVDGAGDPNTSASYAAAIETLYAISYAIKMSHKQTLEYVVPPLEGLWNHPNGNAPTDKSLFRWTALIRQPDFVTADIVEAAKSYVNRKKPALDLTPAHLAELAEGLCVQALHIGPYDTEPVTIDAMRQFAAEQGCAEEIGDVRRHHEIYLSDPRRTAPDKLRTVIRHPVVKLAANKLSA